ncbi:phosphoesterase [Thermococcus sp. P6]|uniref:metallophosphoesterase n=1 Tax=Thermococcus sp. P6 TaxID=122420 RepID=UPI000B599B3D|nr:metallophosphoesterase [Thermococcus sp. P6]ASJ10035.1 phosphoesterase [Thermococcus sp. P6]
MKRAAALFLVLLTLSLIPVNTVKADVFPNEILKFPSTGTPAIAKPGETVTIQAADGVDITRLSIISILNGPYDLNILRKEGGTVIAEIPKEAVPGSYFLQVESSKGSIVIPNGVWVLNEYPKVLRIWHVSDTHVTSGSKVGYVNGEKFCRSLSKCGEGAIPLTSYFATDSAFTYGAMSDEVDVIINTGDDVDTAGDLKGYNLYLNAVENAVATGKPAIIIKGNHDDPPTYYSKLVGLTDFNLTIGKFLIIGLDSHGDQAHPNMDQLEWMESVLEAHPDKIPIVLVHHPFWYKTPEGRSGRIEGYSATDDWDTIAPWVSWYWIGGPDRTSEDIAKRFLEDVEKYNIKLVLSGHVHADYVQVYKDKNGNEHWFVTNTATGAPDKREENNWYGSRIVEIDENGNVRLPYIKDMFGTIFGPLSSLPVPQEFLVFRKTGEDGSGALFINKYKEISGKFVLVAPEGAKVDESATDVEYRLLGERTIGDKHYMLFNVTVPLGEHQIVVTKAPDTTKPTVEIAYTYPSKPKVGKPFQVYLQASDNVGIKEVQVEIVTASGVKKYTGIPTKGDPNGNYFYVKVDGVDTPDYTIRAVAVDFNGNRAMAEKVITQSSSTTSTVSPSTASTTSQSGTCGPAAIVALALIPLLMRRKK